MDIVLGYLDPPLFDPFYSWMNHAIAHQVCDVDTSTGALRKSICSAIDSTSFWDSQSIARQFLSTFAFTMASSTLFYFSFAAVCYYLCFDPALKSHPKFLKNQVRQEIRESTSTLLFLNIVTAPIFVAQLRGHCSKIYDSFDAGPGYWYEIAQFPLFVLFSDTLMYWLHRLFHLPLLFNTMHKAHHRYMLPSPFAAYSFHPIEAFVMSLPVHAYSMVLPISKTAYIVTFFVSNMWTFLLHDSSDSRYHSVHHRNVKFNFGQFLPLWDQLAGTHQDPVHFFSSKGQRSGQS